MKIEPTALDGVVVIEPDIHQDARGHFFEAWQDNFSFSHRGVLEVLPRYSRADP